MRSEIQIQADAFQEMWNNYPETRLCCFHVPNGGSRNKIEGMQLKASGVIAGVPDILFLWNGRLHAFEFKTETGVPSPSQIKVHEAWAKQGVVVSVVRTKEDFMNQIETILALSPSRNSSNKEPFL